MPKPTEPILVWDTCAETQAQADFLREENPELTEDQAFTQACQDSDYLTLVWENLLDCLQEQLTKINPKNLAYKGTVENFGWRRSSGFKTFKAKDSQDFLNQILPETDCTFNVFLEGKTIYIQNFHHDSPTGNEWYTITIDPLEGSIQKWRDIVDGKIADEGAKNCELCHSFVDQDCEGCPVFERSGRSLCLGTPYDSWDQYFMGRPGPRIVTDERTKKLAQDELDFLISLREA